MKEIIWLPYRVYTILLFLISTIIVFCCILFLQLFFEKKKNKFTFFVCKYWSKALMALFFIRIKITGNKNLISKNATIFIANHRSYIDAAVTFYAVPKLFKPLGKVEFGRVPIFGLVYKSVAILVDRSNPYKRARSLKLLKRQVLQGVSVHLYPEGTFNMSDEPLLPFFDGAFKMAIDLQVDIQPYIITGTQQVLHRKHFVRLYPGTIHVEYLPTILFDEIKNMRLNELKEMVFEEMKTALIEKGNW